MTQDLKWQMVPVEPSEAMLEASRTFDLNTTVKGHNAFIYRSMLAAAPSPPAVDGGELPPLPVCDVDTERGDFYSDDALIAYGNACALAAMAGGKGNV